MLPDAPPLHTVCDGPTLATAQGEPLARQEALALPSGDQQGQVAEAHRRTTLAMTDLRATLRDEHHCLLQVRERGPVASIGTECQPAELIPTPVCRSRHRRTTCRPSLAELPC